MSEKINCMWLNTSFGKNYMICDGFLKPVTKEICNKCENRWEKKDGGIEKNK